MKNNFNNLGQSIIEYMLLFACIVFVLIFFLAPKGQFSTSVNKVLDQSISSIECMARSVCYEKLDIQCQPVCGNGCCEAGEKMKNTSLFCPKDCKDEIRREYCGNGVCSRREGRGFCFNYCTLDCGPCPWKCGNGDIEPGEQCDDDNTIVGDGCDGQCQCEPAGSCPSP